MNEAAYAPDARHYPIWRQWPAWQAQAACGRGYLPACRAACTAWLHTRYGVFSLRITMLVGILVAILTLGRMFNHAGALQQDLIVILLALPAGILLALMDIYVVRGPGAPVGVALPATPALPRDTADRATCPSSPDLLSGKGFDDAVRRALTHLDDPTMLCLSPLLRLSQITAAVQGQGLADTRLQRTMLLKVLLTDLVNSLRPVRYDESCTSTEARYYNCLYYPYVRGISRRRAPTGVRALREQRERAGGPCTEQEQVLTWLLRVNEDTYYKWQRRGSDTIALVLREREPTASVRLASTA
jgi:hypothetical protein